MTTPKNIELTKLHPFEGHPYKVKDDAEMEALTESIYEHGILTPLIVRPLEGTTDEYEIVSGHRRFRAAQVAGIQEIPAFVYPLDRDAAVIMLVDSNLHREHILPSEKAFAYKMKMEALNHQGKRNDLTSTQVAQKLSVEMIADDVGSSKDTIRRYIRLTNLNSHILTMVDEGRIAFTPAVEISYLSEWEQCKLVDEMNYADATPNLSQAQRLRKLSQQGRLTSDAIYAVMSEEKANQKERLKIPMERIRKYFPKSYTNAQMEEDIVKMCEARFRKRADRDSR